MSLDDVFHGITTPIKSDFGSYGIADGTGFFYHLIGKEPEDKPSKGLYWQEVEKTWLITNRHALLLSDEDSEKEIMTNKITFYMRRIREDSLIWEPISVIQEELLMRAKPLAEIYPTGANGWDDQKCFAGA